MPCAKKKGKPDEVQKVVIPKGMINPNETTVIEIPAKLQKQPIVIAKRKMAEPYSDMSGPKGHSTRYEDDFYQEMPAKSSQQRTKFGIDSRSTGAQDLERTERQEREQLQRDLDEFQRARRKLVANAAHYSTQEQF